MSQLTIDEQLFKRFASIAEARGLSVNDLLAEYIESAETEQQTGTNHKLEPDEAALRTIADQYETLYHNLPLATYTWEEIDGELVLIDLNDAAVRLAGGVYADHIDNRATIRYKDRPDIVEALNKCIHEQVPLEFEREYTFPHTGNTRMVNVKYAFVPPNRATIHVEDVTDRWQIAKTLRENEERYRLILKAVSDIAFSVRFADDDSLVFDWFSGDFEPITGYASTKDYKSGIAPIHPDDLHLKDEAIQQVKNNQVAISEFRIRHKKGHYVWVRTVRHPIWDATQNRVVGYYGATTNITQRKEMELALRENEERYRLLLRMTSDYAFSDVFDANNVPHVDWLTGDFEAVTGKTEEQFRAANVSKNQVHPDDRAGFGDVLKLLLNNEQVTTEARYLHHDGHYIWLRIHRQPIWDENLGRVVKYYGAATDITQQKEIEAMLRGREERYRLILETVADVAFFIRFDENDETYMEWVSGSIANVTGYEPEEFTLQVQKDYMHPDDREDRNLMLDKVRNNERTINEMRVFHKAGHIVWLRTARQPIWDDQEGRVIGYYGATIDITREKQAEQTHLENEKLQVALEKERELSKIRSQLISTISHEFRTPMTVIMTACDLLRKHYNRFSDEQKLTRIETILMQVNSLEQMLSELTLLYDADRGYLQFVPKQVDISAFFDQFTRIAQAMLQENHNLAVDIRLEGIHMLVDEKLLRHALSNLVSNAVKYSPRGGTIRLTSFIQEHCIICRVEDSGIGMEARQLDKIFQPFFRANNVGTIRGTGLGLAIVKEIMDLHGGSVICESELHIGTTFTIELPIIRDING